MLTTIMFRVNTTEYLLQVFTIKTVLELFIVMNSTSCGTHSTMFLMSYMTKMLTCHSS